MRHMVRLASNVTWWLGLDFGSCRVIMGRRPRWMQPQSPVFSQNALSGLQERNLITTYAARALVHLQPTSQAGIGHLS
jgi:hypothetical protein